RLADLSRELLEASGRGELEGPHRAVSLHSEGVGDPSRQEDKGARPDGPGLVAALDPQRSLEDVERLVLIMVDMPRRGEAARRLELDERVGGAGSGVARLDGHEGAEEPGGVALAGVQDERALDIRQAGHVAPP